MLSPHLKGTVEVTPISIRELLDEIAGKDNPYLIVERSPGSLTFMQTVETAEGYILEYQEGSIDLHYRSLENLERQEVFEALCSYADGDGSWRTHHEFEKIDVMDSATRAGFTLGKLLGRIIAPARKFIYHFRR